MKLTEESAYEIITYNREILYHLPTEYKYLNEYLKGSLRETLLRIYKFIHKHKILIIDHKYLFFADNKTLTYKVRKKAYGETTTSKHVNLLCALGLINKQYQNKDKDILIDINRDFFDKHPDRVQPINVYSYRRYDSRELKRIEQRAERLFKANVKVGNFCQSMLVCHGLEDLANEALPNNDRTAPERKLSELNELMYVMEYITEAQGYVTRNGIKDNMSLADKELDKLFQIFRADILSVYSFKSPTLEQMKKWGLTSKKYIYTRKEQTPNEEKNLL